MKLLFSIFLSVMTAASVCGQAAYTREKEWEREINALIEIDQRQTPPSDAVLFTGSSTIRMWTTLRQDFPRLNVINRGFGGSRLDDLVFFAPKIVAPYKPRAIVVYSGENDIEGKETPENAVADFRKFIEFRDQKLPRTPVIYISMKPSRLRWHLWPDMRRANEMIREEIKRHKNVRFVDISAKMLGAGNTQPAADLFVADGLHLSSKGYAIIREALAPQLAKYYR